MIEIDGVKYYTISELEERKICSRSTIQRRIKEKKLNASRGINGQILIRVDDLQKWLKRNPAA